VLKMSALAPLSKRGKNYADSVTRRHGAHITELHDTNDFLARDLDNTPVRTTMLTTRTDVAQVCHG
jgi:hypothetical protein